jgi:two-component system chemotaxis response regulator CheY
MDAHAAPRILVVEDDPPLRRLARACLESMGLQVDEVSSGKNAIRHLEERTPALVCLDLMLPEISGFDVCDHIRSTPRLSKVPVLVMSTRSHPVDRAYAEEAGAAGYITKPFRIDEFQGEVRKLLRSTGALQ